MQLRTTDEYGQRERDLVRCATELTQEVKRLLASASQVCIYLYSIIVNSKACVNCVSFPLQPSTSSAPPLDHAKEISRLQSMVSIAVCFFCPFIFSYSVLTIDLAFAD